MLAHRELGQRVLETCLRPRLLVAKLRHSYIMLRRRSLARVGRVGIGAVPPRTSRHNTAPACRREHGKADRAPPLFGAVSLGLARAAIGAEVVLEVVEDVPRRGCNPEDEGDVDRASCGP